MNIRSEFLDEQKYPWLILPVPGPSALAMKCFKFYFYKLSYYLKYHKYF